MISLIAAMDRNRVIGVDNKLPWHLPVDLKFFRDKTKGHYVIMGRKTFESVGKPLPNRTNVIITRQVDYKIEGAHVVHSLDAAIMMSRGDDETFIVGGADIYEQSLKFADRVYLTEVDLAVERGDAYFPMLDPKEWELTEKRVHKADEKNKHDCTFLTYAKRNPA